MRIYTASKTTHAHRWKALREQGFKITATWIDEAGEGESVNYIELADRCIREVKDSDVVLLYCEEGELLKGALIEVGAALAMGKPVACVGDCQSLSRVFNKHPLWSRHSSIVGALASLRCAVQSIGKMVKASDLLLQSATPFDQACMMVREMEAEIDRLRALKATK